MADDTLLVPAHVSRRDRLVAARRKRRRKIVVATTIAVLAFGSAAAYAITRDTAAASKQAASKHGTEAAAARKPAELPQVDGLKQKTPPRALTHANPLRVWVGGDSLAGGFGPALGKIAGATGVVHTQVDYKVSSGIANDG